MLLLPLFDHLEKLHLNALNVVLPKDDYRPDFSKALLFLSSYTGSLGTFNSYRREVERLLQWCWLVRKTSLPDLRREDIEQFIRFCQNPPESFIGIKKVPRFIETDEGRKPNPDWRPFIVSVSKIKRKEGVTPNTREFELSEGAISEIFAILSTFFNFLIAEEYLTSNPVQLIRQKSRFMRKHQKARPVRRLSAIQWQAVLDTAHTLAKKDPEKHERTLFMLSLLFGLYLRISELAASPRWTPLMHHFAKDSEGAWWFTTVGKGNSERQIAVSDEVLKSLTRWRTFLGMTPFPNAADTSPLLPKIRGKGPMSDTAPLRRIVQTCFDLAALKLENAGLKEEADVLKVATVHWLRHTGISEDVKRRPREHVRDDAGHRSSITTDRYIDVEKRARHRSARNKAINFSEAQLTQHETDESHHSKTAHPPSENVE